MSNLATKFQLVLGVSVTLAFAILACSTHPTSTTAVVTPVIQASAPAWTWEEGNTADREPASEINKPGGLIKNGKLKTEGLIGQFELQSEKREIPQPMKPAPLTYANMGKDEIAITIDDGPSPENNAFVLKTLKEHGVKAMFFLVGRRIKAHPEIVKNILREGHPVGIHTWTHPDMTKLSSAAAAKEIDDTNALLQKIVKELNKEDGREGANEYRIQPFFRFPYGAGASNPKLQAMLKERNLANFHWSMSMKDSETKIGSEALNTAVGMLDRFDHGLFLMHETHIAGVKALPYFLEQLRSRNYKTIYYEAAP
jgi:peptidoglycan/xylan/chitin deacetylase (PgdA/CDA1 family)